MGQGCSLVSIQLSTTGQSDDDFWLNFGCVNSRIDRMDVIWHTSDRTVAADTRVDSKVRPVAPSLTPPRLPRRVNPNQSPVPSPFLRLIAPAKIQFPELIIPPDQHLD